MTLRRMVINGRFLSQRFSGVQRYAREMVLALDKLEEVRNWHVELVVPPGTPINLPLTNIGVTPFGRGRGHLWEQLWLPLRCSEAVLVSLGNSGPVFVRRQIVVIHDAAVYRHPEHFSRLYGILHRQLGRLLSARAKIMTVSQFSQQELAHFLRIPRGAIGIASPSAEHMMVAEDADEIIERLHLTGLVYIVAVGNLTLNKNLSVVIEAIRLQPSLSIKLVVVGATLHRVFGTHSVPDDGRLVFAGTVTDGELKSLLKHSRALVFPSRYEGFGIPPLEALILGVPVIAADIPPVREVCGNLATYFNPNDPEELLRHICETSEAKAEKRLLAVDRITWASEIKSRNSAISLMGMSNKVYQELL